ncbi:MAG TPA: hypothetical protein GXX72_05025 [Clostridiaceae bacterium]|nr:hypothetical protein [Clostridiaceae bacterium]
MLTWAQLLDILGCDSPVTLVMKSISVPSRDEVPATYILPVSTMGIGTTGFLIWGLSRTPDKVMVYGLILTDDRAKAEQVVMMIAGCDVDMLISQCKAGVASKQ